MPLLNVPFVFSSNGHLQLNEQMKAAALRNSLESQLHEIDALPAALLRRAFSGAL